MSGKDSKAEYDEWKRKQTKALASIQFGEAFGFGGVLGPEGATCQACGAVAVIIATDDPTEQPTVKHRAWHLSNGTATPPPQPDATPDPVGETSESEDQ